MAAKRRKLTKTDMANLQGIGIGKLREEPWRYPPTPDAGLCYSVDSYRDWMARPEAERRETWTNATAAVKRAWVGVREEVVE